MSNLTVKYENSDLLKLASEALYIHKIGTGNRKQYEQYDGKKLVVSHKVAGIKDSSKTVLGN